MNILVAGSRTIATDVSLYHNTVYEILDGTFEILSRGYEESVLIHGGARGVDTEAGRWAEDHGIDVRIFVADWTRGRGAGFIRNIEMVEVADAAIIIWDGQSKGSAHTLNLVQEKNIPYVLVVLP